MTNLDWETEHEDDLAAEIVNSMDSAAGITEFLRKFEEDEPSVSPAETFSLVRVVCIFLSLIAHLALAAVPDSLPGTSSIPAILEFNLVAMPGTPDAPLSGEGIKKGVPDGDLDVPALPEPPKKEAPPPPTPALVEPVVEKPPVPKPTPVPKKPVPRVAKRPAKVVPPKPTVPEKTRPATDTDSGSSAQVAKASEEGASGAELSGANSAEASGAAQPRGLPTGSGSGRFGTSVGGGSTYTFGEAGAPSFLRRVVPKYPRQSVARREEGVVVLLLSLDAGGKLLSVSVEQSAGPRLDEAAIQAARTSTYKPATVNGQAHACTARLPVRFRLRK